MTSDRGAEIICRRQCSYFKPNRTEEERCRGYSLAALLIQERPPTEDLEAVEAFDPLFGKDFLRGHVCRDCPFYEDGCDFVSDDPSEGCLPCGGLVVLSRLLKQGTLDESDIRRLDFLQLGEDSYLALTPRSAVRRLEEDYVYHITNDELYEINDDAAEFLDLCDGTRRVGELAADPEFIEFCVKEDLLEARPVPGKTLSYEGRSPVPSLRYLEWLVTFRCNLKCAHCYLGEAEDSDFPRDLIRSLLDQFSRMQGLRVMVSGGEPTLYKHFDLLNDVMREYAVRAVLLSNGLTLTEEFAASLNFHEVQISLDGMEHGHDAIRGRGAFQAAVRGLQAAGKAGLDLSVATMIHRENLGEWDRMRDLVHELGVKEWSIDYPCSKGRWDQHPGLAVNSEQAAELMRYGFGSSYHGTSPGWTCGRHLAAVLPSGELCKCGLFPEKCYGSVTNGLAEAWTRVRHMPIEETLCAGCAHAESCGGGCRFRAGGDVEKDEVMCRFYGGDQEV